MVADTGSNKKSESIFTKLPIRGRKINILLVFISKPYYTKAKHISINTSFYNENIIQKKTSTNSIKSFL